MSIIKTNRALDITGQKFGRLVALEYAGKYRWKCICDCGNIKSVQTGKLKSGVTRSCGCLKLDIVHVKPKHGMWGTSEYNIYMGMIQRCTNINASGYEYYGGRGIRVCQRWLDSFETFVIDMGMRPLGCSLDRIDVDKNYEPSNCRWATNAQQARNTTRNVFYELFGEKLCALDWAERYGIHVSTIGARLSRGWSLEMAITSPSHSQGRSQ